MSKPELLLIGAGGHARSCIDVIESEGLFQICGMVGLKEQVATGFYGYQVIGLDTDLKELAKKYRHALIVVGQIQSSNLRERLYQSAIDVGFKLPHIISSKAHVSRFAKIGSGTIVMHGAIVNAGATIGENCIINSNALIEHDVKIGDHCHISTGVILNGGVVIGSSSFIGSGSIVKQEICIESKSIVSMGSIIRGDIKDAVQT